MNELNELIRQVADDHPTSAPRDLATYVAKLTPADDVAAFYEDALTDRIAYLLRKRRSATLDAALRGKRDEPTMANRSAKLEQRRTWWQRMLTERVSVGGGEWKTLRECTAADLQACITEREKVIGRIRGQIDNYRTLADLLQRHKVRTVGDLPEQRDMRLFGE